MVLAVSQIKNTLDVSWCAFTLGSGMEWQPCEAECLDAAVSMVGNLIAESGAQRCSQRKALQLLRVDEQVQVPVLVQMLQVDGDFIFREPKSGAAEGLSSAVVYFPCFWQAMHELQKRLSGDQKDNDSEPIAEEVSSFRDATLDLAASQRLTTASFADLLMAFKETSTDPCAWESLLESVRFLMHESKVTKHVNSSRTLQQLVIAQEPLSMAFLAAILLPWLFELCENYRRGTLHEREKLLCSFEHFRVSSKSRGYLMGFLKTYKRCKNAMFRLLRDHFQVKGPACFARYGMCCNAAPKKPTCFWLREAQPCIRWWAH